MALDKSFALTPTCPAMFNKPLRTMSSLSFVSPADVTRRVVEDWKSVAIFTEATATPTPTNVVALPSLVKAPPTPPIFAVKLSPVAAASDMPRRNGAVSARSRMYRSATSAMIRTRP